MIKDLIGKKVQVAVFNDAFVTTGELVSVEGNWIKVDTKKQIKLINADHIQTIVVSK
jgi:small nuclear ribonucleoprotein (snRNP)-like protein